MLDRRRNPTIQHHEHLPLYQSVQMSGFVDGANGHTARDWHDPDYRNGWMDGNRARVDARVQAAHAFVEGGA